MYALKKLDISKAYIRIVRRQIRGLGILPSRLVGIVRSVRHVCKQQVRAVRVWISAYGLLERLTRQLAQGAREPIERIRVIADPLVQFSQCTRRCLILAAVASGG